MGSDVAKAAYQERGLHLDSVNTVESTVSFLGMGKTADIQFKGMRQNRPVTIHVTLRKPTNLMAWQAVEVREEPDN